MCYISTFFPSFVLAAEQQGLSAMFSLLYFKATPKGQLPIMEVDGKMMCESMAMARYVATECSKLFTFTT